MNAVDMRINKTLIRREFWENRSLWLVPAVVIGVFTFFAIIKMAYIVSGHSGGENIHLGGDDPFMDDGPDLANADPSDIAGFIRVSSLFMAIPFNGIMLIVVFFYLLDSLYADRRDRSVLFWRSMPVSDTRTVLAKLVTAIFAATAITFCAVIVTQLIAIIFQLLTGAFGKHSLVLLSHPLALLEGWALLAYTLILQSIWFLPFFGWWMLASAWAKKAPFLWAVLPPAMIVIAEGSFLRTHHFWNLIGHHAVDWMGLVFNLNPFIDKQTSGRDLLLSGDFVSLAGLGRYLASPELWIGTALAFGFIYGAIILRRKRSEI